MSGAEGPLKIAVAGGSIGGPCAGLALRGAGFDVQVYERVSGPMETRGAGIVVQGELIELLRTHGKDALPTTHCTVPSVSQPRRRRRRGPVRAAGLHFVGGDLSHTRRRLPLRPLPAGCNTRGFRQRRRRGAGAYRRAWVGRG